MCVCVCVIERGGDWPTGIGTLGWEGVGEERSPGWGGGARVVDPRKVVVGFSALPSLLLAERPCCLQPVCSPHPHPLYTPEFSSFPLENRRILVLF